MRAPTALLLLAALAATRLASAAEPTAEKRRALVLLSARHATPTQPIAPALLAEIARDRTLRPHLRAHALEALASAREAAPVYREIIAEERGPLRHRALLLLAEVARDRGEIEKHLADPDPTFRRTVQVALQRLLRRD